ncbi:MAG: dolichyl-phosphate beta-glucosyltransferase [Archaeoglobaceae archaeon]
MPQVSVVLPVYNEADKLENAVNTLKKYLEQLNYSYEIIIAEDGSTDGTDNIASRITMKDNKIRHYHSDFRLGKGEAILRAFKSSKGDVLVHMDVDLSTHMKHLRELVDAIAVEGYDIATGSRLMKESKTTRPAKRDVASKGYNSLIRLLLGSKLRDHQCGFKAFKKEVILDLANEVKDNHWFWDTEVLILAQRKNYRIKEFPVEWSQDDSSKVELKTDALYMLRKLLGMVFRH